MLGQRRIHPLPQLPEVLFESIYFRCPTFFFRFRVNHGRCYPPLVNPFWRRFRRLLRTPLVCAAHALIRVGLGERIGRRNQGIACTGQRVFRRVRALFLFRSGLREEIEISQWKGLDTLLASVDLASWQCYQLPGTSVQHALTSLPDSKRIAVLLPKL